LHLASPKLTVVNTLGGVHHASKAISLATVPLPSVAISSRGQTPPEALRMAMRDFAGVSGAILQCKARERLLTHSRTRPCRRIRRTRLRWGWIEETIGYSDKMIFNGVKNGKIPPWTTVMQRNMPTELRNFGHFVPT
jgi:hypothetical protein